MSRQTRERVVQLPLAQRLVLALLPAHVRNEHETELLATLTDEREKISWRALVLDVLRAAPQAHADVLRQDLRLAVRSLRRSPTFSLVAISTMAIGLGGNLAFFALTDGVLFQPLRVLDEKQLVVLTEENIPRGLRLFGVSPAAFRDYARDRTVFEAAAAYQVRSGTVRNGTSPERVVSAHVSGDFFRVFREQPVMGRTLNATDDVPGANSVVVSHIFHERTLGSDAGAIGRTIEVDGQPLTIVGVMPSGFDFPNSTVELWRPLAMTASQWQERGSRYLSVIARLNRDVHVTQAAASVSRVAQSLAAAYPSTNKDWSVNVRNLRAQRVDAVRSQLYLMWAAGALVLLVAIANVGGLFIAKAVARQREFALRSALGARAGRVARQVTTEALVLTGLSTVFGLGLAALVLQWVQRTGSGVIPRLLEVSIGWRAIGASLVLAVVAALVLGLLSVPSVNKRDVWISLGSARSGSRPGRRRRLRALVVGEVALACFVLIAASLVARTMRGLFDQRMGYDPHNVLVFRVEPPFQFNQQLPEAQFLAEMSADRHRVAEKYRTLFAAVRALPGVVDVGAINRVPLTGSHWVTSVERADRPSAVPGERMQVWVRPVTDRYFQAMRTLLLQGRDITSSDVAGSERVVVVDEAFARKGWGAESPIGHELVLDGPPNQVNRARVIGVVESVHMNQLDADFQGTMYVPIAQSLEGFFPNWGMDVVVRSSGAPLHIGDFRRLVREHLADAVMFNDATMESLIAASVADRRFQLVVLSIFSGIAVVLAAVGVGGALLLLVRERHKELAVRLALGARPQQIWWQVQGGGIVLVAFGSAIGTLCAFAGARVFNSIVYGVSVRDPISFIGAPLLLCLAAFVAIAIPATYAIRVQVTAALRET